MADWYHGIKTKQEPTSVGTPIVAPSGIPLFIGIAPVHMVDGQVNVPVLGNVYKDAVEALGYSDNWKNYSLCQAIYSHYVLYQAAPAVFVNLLDPSKHKKAVAAVDIPLTDEQCLLPLDAIKSSVVTKESAGGSAEYVADVDYTLFYSGENLILEILAGGSISTSATALNIAYDEVDPSLITKIDVIGGFDVATKKSTGLELVDAVFPKFLVIPDLLVCPGFSSDPEVAAVMGAKMDNINGLFTGLALIDADSKTVTHYTDIPQWKKDNNIFRTNQIVLWPKVKMADRTFDKSVQMAGLMAHTDSDYGCPTESPSNKSMQITATVLDDATDTTPATEVNLDIAQANYLNQNGVVTALNFIGGFVAWGNETACYLANNDVKDYFINVNRMFSWVQNTVILTTWKWCDRNLRRRLIETVQDNINIWLGNLAGSELIAGGRVEFRSEENPETQLMAGKAVFHVFLTPFSPAKELEFIFEYDVSYLSTLFSAAA